MTIGEVLSGVSGYDFKFFLKSVTVEGFYDIIGCTGVFSDDDVYGLAFCGDNDELQMFQCFWSPNFMKKLDAGHGLHVLIGNDEIKKRLVELLKSFNSIFLAFNICKPEPS